MIGRKIRNYSKIKMIAFFVGVVLIVGGLAWRLGYLMITRSDYYGDRAVEVRERTRKIKAMRGKIYDRDGKILASNRAVCTISVINSQIEDEKEVIDVLSKELDLDRDDVEKKVKKISSMERICVNVEKKIGDKIREKKLKGVMIDEDYKRMYPYNSLASKVIGFTGGDNQGVVGLEVKYDSYLKGVEGKILTITTANGIEVEDEGARRVEPIDGYDLYITLDYEIQKYAEYVANSVLEKKNAKSVNILIMNPNNGEIYACVNAPEYNLNKPYEYIGSNYSNEKNNDSKNNTAKDYKEEFNKKTSKEKNELLNDMWRNDVISDTYEPGSTFKIITSAGALEEGVLKVEDTFNCPGFKIVEDRKIRCHKVKGHGIQTFEEGIMNSCNPVFMEIGARLGAENLYKYFRKLGLFEKTGIDLSGEANSIMHNIKNIKSVELATISFGQSIQITPLQLLRATSAIINGGKLITPHIAKEIRDNEGNKVKKFEHKEINSGISEKTSAIMRELLEAVVRDGSGKNACVDGLRVGGKTATSEKLPRRSGKYISSFLGFAPANKPNIIALIMIDEPVGSYYGGTIAAPSIAKIFKNMLNSGNSNLIILE